MLMHVHQLVRLGFLALSLFTLPCSTLWAMGQRTEASWFSFDDLATPSEQKEMGISRLKSGEKQKLEEWIGDWSARIVETAAERGTLNYPGVGNVFSVQEVLEQGQYIVLDNGSRWEVAAGDRTEARYWNPREKVSVAISTTLKYPKKLLRENGTSVDVFFVSQPESTKASYTLKALHQDGQYLQLSDLSVWEISRLHQLQTLKWNLGDTIIITLEGDFLYPYTLTRSVGKENSVTAAKFIGVLADGETRIAEILSNGAVLHLANHTFWEVDQDTQSLTWTWQSKDPISIVLSGDRHYPFLVINLKYNQTVLARVLDRPILIEHRLAEVRNFGALVKLDDGSSWEILRDYQKQVWLWSEGDFISIRLLSGNRFRMVNTSKDGESLEALYLGN